MILSDFSEKTPPTYFLETKKTREYGVGRLTGTHLKEAP